MIERNRPLISRRWALKFAACVGLGALTGCSNPEEGTAPKLTKSKKDLLGGDDFSPEGIAKLKHLRGRRP
jgi:hypothetical protein